MFVMFLLSYNNSMAILCLEEPILIETYTTLIMCNSVHLIEITG